MNNIKKKISGRSKSNKSNKSNKSIGSSKPVIMTYRTMSSEAKPLSRNIKNKQKGSSMSRVKSITSKPKEMSTSNPIKKKSATLSDIMKRLRLK